MYRSGIRYSEAVREFQRVFILTVLQEHKANQVRAAQKLGMHRNTLRRIIRNFELDIRLSRPPNRRPPMRAASLGREEGQSDVAGTSSTAISTKVILGRGIRDSAV